MAEVQERLDGLLEALESAGASGGDDAAGGAAAADQSDVMQLLGLAQTAQDAGDLVDALTDYYVYGQAAAALEASRTLVEQTLDEQQRLLQQGQTTQSAADSAQDRLDALDRQIAQYRIRQEQARLVAENLTGQKPDDYELSGVLLVFDPTKLDVSDLCEKALAYAEGIAAGRREVDAGKLEVNVKKLVLDMSMAYENVRAGQKSLAQSGADLEAASQSYATGSIGKAALYDAQVALNDTVSAQFQTVGAYTKLVNQLNDLSGGWVAGSCDWLAEPFGTIYDLALRQAAAEAEEAGEVEEAEETEEAEKDEEAGQDGPDAGESDSGETEGGEETAVPDTETAPEPENDRSDSD